MKQSFLIIFLFGSLMATAQTYYQGLERMCWTNKNGKVECYDSPRKWYHLNTILVDNDSIFMYKVPVMLEKRDTIFSASDGAFYYYYGTIKKVDTSNIAYLRSYNCDYCGMMIREDSLTGYQFPIPRLDTLKIITGTNSLKIGKTVYHPYLPTGDNYFPAKSVFYFDSNSISRRNPAGQYNLISQAIKNFLQTKELKLDKDTLRVCIERFEFFEKTKLIETLSADSFNIDTTNIYFDFLTRDQLKARVKNENKVIRYIEINEIVDYWKAARVELTYKILLPKSIHKFSEREYNNLFEYTKVGQKYTLSGDLPENSWGLIEQK